MTVVAFFADANVLPALHVALASTLANWKQHGPLSIDLLHHDISTRDLALLDETVARSAKPARWRRRAFDPSRVAKWRSLYGSPMPYGRLFLADLIPDERHAIYLDVDVIVELDVNDLPPPPQDGLLAAMPAWDFEHSHDAALAQQLGIAGSDLYFHSGFLLWNLEVCRRETVVQQFVEFGDRHAQQLFSHDQTILNFVCKGRIASIPPALTSHLYPTNARRPEGTQTIQNFCGAPKPFDLFGNALNDHYALFKSWIDRTALRGWSPNEIGQFARVSRNVRLLRPMIATAAKMLLRRVRGQKRSK